MSISGEFARAATRLPTKNMMLAATSVHLTPKRSDSLAQMGDDVVLARVKELPIHAYSEALAAKARVIVGKAVAMMVTSKAVINCVKHSEAMIALRLQVDAAALATGCASLSMTLSCSSLVTTVSSNFSLVPTVGAFCVSAMAIVFVAWNCEEAVCGTKRRGSESGEGNLVNNAHGVRLSSLHGVHNGIVMPTWPGCMYNQIEILPTGASGRVDGCVRYHFHLSFLYCDDSLYVSKQGQVGSVTLIHGYNKQDHYPPHVVVESEVVRLQTQSLHHLRS